MDRGTALEALCSGNDGRGQVCEGRVRCVEGLGVSGKVWCVSGGVRCEW